MPRQDFDNLVEGLKKKNQQNKDRYTSLSDQQSVIKSLDAVQNAVVQSMNVLITSLLEDTLNTKVTNQIQIPSNIGTPDALAGAQQVKTAIEQLQTEVSNKHVDLEPLVSQIQAVVEALGLLPTEYPEIPEMPSEMAVNNLGEVCGELKSLSKEVQKLKLDPKIEVKSPDVKIDLSKELKAIEKAVKSISKDIVIPEYPELDTATLVESMNSVKDSIEEIQFPVPNFRTQDIVDEMNKVVGFELGEYDYIALTYVASGNGAGEIETVTYKTGGSGGTTVATLTLGYDASNRLNSVTKS